MGNFLCVPAGIGALSIGLFVVVASCHNPSGKNEDIYRMLDETLTNSKNSIKLRNDGLLAEFQGKPGYREKIYRG